MKKRTFILVSFLVAFFLLTNLALSLDKPWKEYRMWEDPWQECKAVLPDTSNNGIEQVDITKANIFIIHIFSNIRITIISLKGIKSGEEFPINSYRINHDNWHGFKRK